MVAAEAEQSASADSAAAAPVEQAAPPPAVPKTQAMPPAPPEKKLAPAKATFDPAAAAAAAASTDADATSATMPAAAAAATTATPNANVATVGGTSESAVGTAASAPVTPPAKAQRRRALPAVSDPDQPVDASPAQLPGVAGVGLLPVTLKDASQRTGPGLMQQAFTHEVGSQTWNPRALFKSMLSALEKVGFRTPVSEFLTVFLVCT